MRLVNVNYIDCNQYEYYVGRPICADGNILLQQGVKLTESYIKQLIAKKINYIYIVDQISEGIEITEIMPMEKHMEVKETIKNQFNDIKKGKNIGLNMTIINNTVSELLDILTYNKDISFNINQLRMVDDYLYEHSLNVTISSLYIGILLKYDKMRLQKLALGALLHDVGKLFIDSKVLNKPSKLNAEERNEIEKHPELGYRYITDNYGNEVNPASKQIILQHHEKWNGTGYPNQLLGDGIYELARICCIADVFDALTTDRVYKKASPIYMASEYMHSLSHSDFDFEILKLFLSKVVKFKEGSIVRLSDNSKAIVYSQNKHLLDRPVVKLLVTKDGKFVDNKDMFLDLIEEKTLFIEKQIENIYSH